VSIPFGVAIYFVIWWTVLFAVLPFAGHSQQEAGARVPGTPASAPAAPKLLRVAVITSVIAAAILGLILLSIEYDLLTRIGYPLRAPEPPAG
jgi:predicted secreted protein